MSDLIDHLKSLKSLLENPKVLKKAKSDAIKSTNDFLKQERPTKYKSTFITNYYLTQYDIKHQSQLRKPLNEFFNTFKDNKLDMNKLNKLIKELEKIK